MTDLFDYAPPPSAHARAGDIETSHEAAEYVTPHIRVLQGKVLEFARECGAEGFTDVQLNHHFATASSTYRTRRSELVEKGMIEDSGLRIRAGESGRRHAIWRITDRGRAA